MKDSYEVQAISHLSSTLLARKLILQFWKSDLNCGNELHLEKIRFTTADIEEPFQKIWAQYIKYILVTQHVLVPFAPLFNSRLRTNFGSLHLLFPVRRSLAVAALLHRGRARFGPGGGVISLQGQVLDIMRKPE